MKNEEDENAQILKNILKEGNSVCVCVEIGVGWCASCNSDFA